MKRIFYSFMPLLLSAILLSGISSKAQTYHITFPNAPPAVTDASLINNDHFTGPMVPEDAIENGIRFRVSQPGTVTGIRFFKGSSNAANHVGHLWTNTGTQLAESFFTSETASGWQETPVSVHITPGADYVASVFSDNGDYGVETGDNTWPGTTDFGPAPIFVIASGNDPAGNGVYTYVFRGIDPNGLFPNQTFGSPNYWIDISFVTDFPLPVVLSDFKATPSNNNVLLNWQTASEYNSRGFEIQRSNNSVDWYPVSFVAGAGESTTARSYNYTDKGLAPGAYYYRLNQTDYDGKSTLSSIVKVIIGGKGAVSLFPGSPNPFSTTTTIRYDLPKTQKVRLSVVDMMGREVKLLSNSVNEAGSHLVTLDAVTLQRQLYLVRLQTDDGVVLTQKILVN